MVRYKELVTMKLVEKNSHEVIGDIVDTAYDSDYRKVTHLVVKNNNLIKNKFPILLNDAIISLEDQIVYIDNKNWTKEELGISVIEPFNFLDKEVKTEKGECVGFIKDIIIDVNDGSILGFIITEGIFEDFTQGRNFIPLFYHNIIKENSIFISDKDKSNISKNN